MFKDIPEYLKELKKELKGCDPAMIQDALSDAEGHLRMALEESLSATPGLSQAEAIGPVTEKYGNPKEIASAYRTIESRISPSLAVPRRKETRSSWARFFGVLAEPKAWGAFFYMLLSLVTGVVFGGWALFAGIISFSSLVFIIGIPIVGLFLAPAGRVQQVVAWRLDPKVGQELSHVYIKAHLHLTRLQIVLL